MFSSLNCIRTVADERSFSRAAQRLHISQPALSALVKKTEKELGATLFDRTARPVALTEEGRIYLEAGERVMRIERETRDRLDRTASRVSGTLRIGASNSLALAFAPKLIAGFLGEHPLVSIRFFELPTVELVAKIVSDQLDLLIDTGEGGEGLLLKTPLFTQRIFLAAPSDGALAGALADRPVRQEGGIRCRRMEPTDFRLLSGCPLLALSEENDLAKRTNRFFREHGIEPDVRMKFDQMATSYRFAALGLGACFVGDTVVEGEAEQPTLALFEIDDPLMERPVFVARARRGHDSTAMRAFVEFAAQRGRTPGGEAAETASRCGSQNPPIRPPRRSRRTCRTPGSPAAGPPRPHLR